MRVSDVISICLVQIWNDFLDFGVYRVLFILIWIKTFAACKSVP